MDYTLEERAITHHSGPGWVLTTANAAGTSGLMYFLKHGAQDNKILVTHLTTDQRCLTSAVARQSTLTARPSNCSQKILLLNFYK
jgi:hypothetical protein